ncbi:MAG: NAD(P)H-dependent oxidoreductase [bacterium]|nr:NAD(P)H-dependent oxidoreductase [bacterium]
MKKNTLIILGHPDKDSFCGALARAYVEGARQAGIEIKEIEIGSIKFDPVLWRGYKEIQELEPDLVKAQKLILQTSCFCGYFSGHF